MAIAALALPAAAQSAIELYGKAHVSLDAIGNGDALAGDEPVKKYGLLVTSNQSYIGLRGNERLRDRLSAIWQFEQGVDIDDGSWSDEGRDSFVGLEGGLGVLLAGRHVTPYRKLSDELDIFRDTRADHSAVIGAVDGQSLFNERARNIVYYATLSSGVPPARLSPASARARARMRPPISMATEPMLSARTAVSGIE